MNKKESMFVLVVTFVVSMVWIASDLYHTRASIAISSKLDQTLEGVDPSFDQEALNQISRLPNAVSVTTPVFSPSPNPIPTPPTSSPSAIESSQSALSR